MHYISLKYLYDFRKYYFSLFFSQRQLYNSTTRCCCVMVEYSWHETARSCRGAISFGKACPLSNVRVLRGAVNALPEPIVTLRRSTMLWWARIVAPISNSICDTRLESKMHRNFAFELSHRRYNTPYFHDKPDTFFPTYIVMVFQIACWFFYMFWDHSKRIKSSPKVVVM